LSKKRIKTKIYL